MRGDLRAQPLATVKAAQVLVRSERHDPGGIDRVVGHVIVPFDVIEIHGVGDAVILVEVFQIAEKVGVIGDTSNIAFEVPMVHSIEADEGDEQSPVRLYNA